MKLKINKSQDFITTECNMLNFSKTAQVRLCCCNKRLIHLMSFTQSCQGAKNVEKEFPKFPRGAQKMS